MKGAKQKQKPGRPRTQGPMSNGLPNQFNSLYYTRGNPKDWSDKQDWPTFKDEFFNTRLADNSYAFPTINSFVREKFPDRSKDDQRHRRWMLWSIGPSAVKAIAWQGDWEGDRLLSNTKFSQQTAALKEKIQSELDLLDAGKVLADSYLPLQQRVFDLWKELEAYCGGSIIRDVSSITDDKKRKAAEDSNFKRMRLYMSTFSWIVDLKLKLDNQFLRALGWDRPQFIAYFEGLRKDAARKGEVNAQSTAVSDMLIELTKNQIEKSKMYEIELPEDIKTVADAMDEEKEKV